MVIWRTITTVDTQCVFIWRAMSHSRIVFRESRLMPGLNIDANRLLSRAEQTESLAELKAGRGNVACRGDISRATLNIDVRVSLMAGNDPREMGRKATSREGRCGVALPELGCRVSASILDVRCDSALGCCDNPPICRIVMKKRGQMSSPMSACGLRAEGLCFWYRGTLKTDRSHYPY
jgi:hypothetical protein